MAIFSHNCCSFGLNKLRLYSGDRLGVHRHHLGHWLLSLHHLFWGGLQLQAPVAAAPPSHPSAGHTVPLQEVAVPEAVAALAAGERALGQVVPPVFQGPPQCARALPADGALEARLAARGPGGVPQGVVDQDGGLSGVGGTGADGAGEAFNGYFHGGQSGDSHRASLPCLHVHPSSFDPQLSQQLLPGQLLLHPASLPPHDHQLPLGLFAQRHAHQLAPPHDAVDLNTAFLLLQLSHATVGVVVLRPVLKRVVLSLGARLVPAGARRIGGAGARGVGSRLIE